MSDDLNGNGDWKEWSKFVLKELARLNDCYDKLAETYVKISTEVAMLKVKSGMWGLIGGAIPVIIGLAYWMLKKESK